jgi:hypothetical protein
MSVLFAAASSAAITNTEGEVTFSSTIEETQPPLAKKKPSRRKSKEAATPKPTVEERNKACRARAAEKRNRIAFIRNIPQNQRTDQEQRELEQEEVRKHKKILQSKQRLALENANLARIQALAPEQWTEEDKTFMAKVGARKKHKNHSDRQRLQRLKEAKEKAQLASQPWQVFVSI